MPTSKNRDGLVCINFKKTETEIKQNQQQVVDSLQKLMGNRQNLAVCVEAVKALPDDKYELFFKLICFNTERKLVFKVRLCCDVFFKTRMHSSRMRTVRCSSHLWGWGCLPKGGVGPGGCVCLAGDAHLLLPSLWIDRDL